MDKFVKSISLRKKKEKPQDDDPNSKPLSWQEDERKVREGCCSFQVKYLGHIEVFDSRGMQVCEEAIKALRRPKKATRAILYVSGDTIRVSDEISKGLIVDQTIEKVSFCSPDRNHKRGFAYICRDGTTRRWMCHAFLAVKESGERLSHAVGCAFAICLEKKQKRESEVSQLVASENKTVQKAGSFRQASLTERLQDPQSAIIAEPPMSSPHPPAINAVSPAHSRAAVIPRPHASVSFFSERQTSLRMFPKLQESSPFKRELSLRLAELPNSVPKMIEDYQSDEKSTMPDNLRNHSDRQFPFPSFTKSLCPSEHSASDSPAHRMSTSAILGSQSDSTTYLNSNPFLISGIVNYGASSSYTSQEALSSTDAIFRNEVLRDDKDEKQLDQESKFQINQAFQSMNVSEFDKRSSFDPVLNGFADVPTSESDKALWSSAPLYTNTTRETASTNPWSETKTIDAKQATISSPSHRIQHEFHSVSDPFDISWINCAPALNKDHLNSPAVSNNPFWS